MPRFDEWYDAPPYQPEPPPPGVRANRASVWCGTKNHPRAVLTGKRESALWEALDHWRCPQCGKSSW